LSNRGLEIWVGSEPTFTDRTAQTPEWLHAALGGDKERRARRLLAALHARLPGGVILRCDGRHYPGESQRRWCLGLYRRRNGEPIWRGPLDPLAAMPSLVREDASAAAADVPVTSELARHGNGVRPTVDAAALATALTECLGGRGWTVGVVELRDAADRRFLLDLARDESEPCRIEIGASADDEGPCLRMNLPEVQTPATWLELLGAAQSAATVCGLGTLVIGGAVPPVDASVEMTTVTPDPAVIEVNSAPCATATVFLQQSRAMYAAADEVGLAPFRLYFNGTIADSGGGGQLTIGGPAPERSPFWLVPQLLPRLVRCFITHPSLSYLFAHDFLGTSGQSVRPDERGYAAFGELHLALWLLERASTVTLADVWHRLAPFLSDAVGNPHRADINVEKLCNPHLPVRGALGLVEFRSLRMQHTAERVTALACLLRSLVAMLMHETQSPPLVDWGRELHERFALPFFLAQDFEQVLAGLHRSGFGLGQAIEDELRRDEFRHWAELPLPGCMLQIRRAIEFWPLIGDAASPEQSGTSRLVDASTTRIEIRMRPHALLAGNVLDTDSAPADWRAWQIGVAGQRLPMRLERDSEGECLVYGLRYRSFNPLSGLHPGLGSQAPVAITLGHADLARAYVVTLHEWRPDGQAYAGLPVDLSEARRRLAERVTLQTVSAERIGTESHDEAEAPHAVPGLGPYCLDLRYVERAWRSGAEVPLQ
jgi:uncharacterized protein (DUF2126 family)